VPLALLLEAAEVLIKVKTLGGAYALEHVLLFLRVCIADSCLTCQIDLLMYPCAHVTGSVVC